MPLDALLADFDDYMSSADHVEFYWAPHTRWALTKRNRRTDEPARPRGRVREFVDDILLPNVVFGALCRVGRRRPDLIPRLARILPSTGRTEYIDRSHRVFTSPRLVRFYEMEYAIARNAVPEALNRLRRLVDDEGLRVSFPVEVRVVAADDSALSTAYGRPTGYMPSTSTGELGTRPTSAGWSGSWTAMEDGPTGARSTTRTPIAWPGATPGGTTSRPHGGASTPKDGSPTRTSIGSWGPFRSELDL